MDNLSPEVQPNKSENIVSEVTTIVSDTSKILNSIKTILMIIGVLGVLYILIRGISCNPIHLPFKIAPTKITNTDTSKPINVSNTSVTYTPKPTKLNPHPVPITNSKPVEGKVKILNDTITIQNSGLTFEPKAGLVYVPGENIQWVAGARFFFAGSFGLEGLINDRYIFLGVDLRDPIFNNLTTSIGACDSYNNLLGIKPYISESVILVTF